MVHRTQLQHHGSTLEFHLRQRKFLFLLSTGRTQEALAYAKVLGQFVPKHTPGIPQSVSLIHLDCLVGIPQSVSLIHLDCLVGIPQSVSLIHLDCLKTGWYTTVSQPHTPRLSGWYTAVSQPHTPRLSQDWLVYHS